MDAGDAMQRRQPALGGRINCELNRRANKFVSYSEFNADAPADFPVIRPQSGVSTNRNPDFSQAAFGGMPGFQKTEGNVLGSVTGGHLQTDHFRSSVDEASRSLNIASSATA
jgi:hypothetical protein